LFFKKQITYHTGDLQSILDACKLQDAKAQRELISQYYGYAYTICNLYGKSNEETEEMINDGFLKVFTNLDKYKPEKHFKAWFRTVLVNSCIDYYRKYNVSQNIISLDQAFDIEVEDDVFSNFTGEDIQLFVSELPDACRIVFTLYVIEGYSHKEISEQLGIQEGTSKSNLRDARIKLKCKLANYFDDEKISHSTAKIK
jgi:RNA polymerase sigma-70 factor, ECF subfamily